MSEPNTRSPAVAGEPDGDGGLESVALTPPTRVTRSRATLADVARLAGVSAKTVSRVFSGNAYVADQTRDRVMAAANRLRFRPNDLARSLRHGGVANTVGFVMGDITNQFYFQVAAGMERELAKHGITMILAATEDDPGSEERVVETLLNQRVRALVIVPIAADQSYLEGERQLGTPVICVDRPARNLVADAIVLRNRSGTADAVRALVTNGHRRIGFICSPGGLYTHEQRLAGYRDALREAGVTDSRRWERLKDVDGRPDEESARELMALPDPPTAIVAGNNHASAGVIRALGERRSEIAFIGFDDFELADALGISVIAYDTLEMGRRAALRLLERLDDPTGPPQHIEVDTHVIARGSGEIPPAS
ncbi:LacI family DNA-binding transcriptional regulator [Phytoactinopolyspora halotolerans]|uniref:LacI family DNA-binding transcriptional regulator n=1 Tax=Phytoactinopolyspora halotolerans TaxID=1981512 RepID=UPI001C206301|nr:LacI family DNA-binding transcriptional regulator [Phytoactinopolyspora halotolerans]